ncbi:hypothetical protein EON65_47175 [archaeon]|nr:MAG: hypothetical protein EON65_47175 [archaeon]
MDVYDDDEQPAIMARPYSRAQTPGLKALARTLRVRESAGTYKMRSRGDVMRERITHLFEVRRARMLSQRLKDMPLSQATKDTRKGEEHFLALELRKGYNPNVRDKGNGRTLLHEACASGHYPIVRMLLMEYEIDVNAVTVLGSLTALHLAVEKGHRRIVSMLLGHGANIHAIDDQGCMPVHRVNKLSIAKVLLKYKVDLLHRNKRGHTPLEHYQYTTPSKEQDKDLVELLKYQEDLAMVESCRERLASIKMNKNEQLKQAALATSAHTAVVGKLKTGYRIL